jgi:hypothetical protein
MSSSVCPYSYRLTGGNGQFSINPGTGQIITSSLLDREARANYQLLVVATDGGQPLGMSSSATVSVVVDDINDNPPRFHHHPYVTHIPAFTTAGGFRFDQFILMSNMNVLLYRIISCLHSTIYDYIIKVYCI